MADFTFHTPENTSAHAKTLFNRIKNSYGFIPNLFAYMAEAPTTVEAYLALNDLVSKTSFTPPQQQVALLAISVENECSFCTTAHRAVGKQSKANQQTLDALAARGEIDDAKDRVLAATAQSLAKNRGHLPDSEIDVFLEMGFTKQQLLELILMVSIKTLSNYINHLTNPEPNDELVAML